MLYAIRDLYGVLSARVVGRPRSVGLGVSMLSQLFYQRFLLVFGEAVPDTLVLPILLKVSDDVDHVAAFSSCRNRHESDGKKGDRIKHAPSCAFFAWSWTIA